MKSIYIILAFLSVEISFSQSITGKELLDKAIAYHDPNGNWQEFNGKFLITMESPNSPKRVSNIHINLPTEYFYVKARRDTIITEYTLNKSECTIAFNGDTKISEETLKANNLSCDRAKMYKNYYTYLYGLPMKLKDPGTKISETVERKIFKGKEYLVLEAKYDEAVGSDVWYFYFDPFSYAMEIYQFYKGDPNGKGKDTGEYILLAEEATVQDIIMPKNRAWYYNKDDKFLGTDKLNTNE